MAHRYLVQEARALGVPEIIDRCNLTVLLEPGQVRGRYMCSCRQQQLRGRFMRRPTAGAGEPQAHAQAANTASKQGGGLTHFSLGKGTVCILCEVST